MKILIWVLGYLVMTLVYILTYGILANAGSFIQWVESLLYLVAWILISITLCKKWDKHKIKIKAEKEGTSEIEFVKREIPSSLRNLCEDQRGNKVALESLLDNCVKNGTISRTEAVLLLEEYSDA